MAEYSLENFARKDLSFIQDGDVFYGCNLSQNRINNGADPVEIPLVILYECNFQNVWPAEDSTIQGGNDSQIDQCYWLNPNIGLPVEEENCRHVTEKKEVKIDGVVVDELTEYVRENKKCTPARWRDR